LVADPKELAPLVGALHSLVDRLEAQEVRAVVIARGATQRRSKRR
jgi:hypothetical protein